MLEDVIQMHRAGRLPEAEAGYRELLEQNPDDPEVLHLLGIVRGQQGDLQEALQLVARACELDPDNATCQYTLGDMHLREGKLDEAEHAYDQARMLNPNLAATHDGLGQVALRRGDLDAAESRFRVALRADDKDAAALTGLGTIAQVRGDTARALQLFTQAAELAPGDPEIQTQYARAMLDQGMPDFAGRALDNALGTQPGHTLALAVRAEVHVRKGELAQALPILEGLIARGEQLGAAYTALGDIARLRARHDEAVAHYDEALRVEPDLHQAAIRRSDALSRSNRMPQAIELLRAYVDAHPDAIKPQVALAHLLAQAGRHGEALAAWSAAETRWPQDIDIKALCALALDRAGRFDEALAKADQAAGSPRPAIAMLRARGALLSGDPAAAVQRLQRIDESVLERMRMPLKRRRQRLLGLAFDALEQWAEAVDAFMAAQHLTAGRLPELPPLDAETRGTLRGLAEQPDLDEPGVAAPILLCGLPGSGVGQVAALLADQSGGFVRRERFESVPDFISAPFDDNLLRTLDKPSLAMLARRYRRPLERAQIPEDTQVIDWIPVLDARVLPAVKRALPGVRLLLAVRDPQDMLLDWLGFGWSEGFSMPDPLAGARWLRLAAAHLELAAQLLPTLRVDPDALLSGDGEDVRRGLAGFLGRDAIEPGPLARAALKGRGGLPVSFPSGHASHYRELLSEAFATLDGI